jgi:hypothetical protein
MKTFKLILSFFGILFAIFLAGAVRGDTAELMLTSQPGDFIGQGQTKDIIYTPSNSDLFIEMIEPSRNVNGQPAFLSFILGTVTGSNTTNTFSTLNFGTDQLGIPFQPGVYGLPGNTAQRAVFASSGHPGLDVTFQNRGSNTLTGNFTVNSVQFFSGPGNTEQIGELDVNFEQHSEGATPALFGHFTFFATGFGVPDSGSTLLLLLLGISVLCCFRLALVRRLG